MTQTETATGTVDIHSEAFARRLANLLAERRRQRGTTLRKLARASGRAFSAQDLRAFEEARAEIDAARLGAVVDLYGADVEAIMADRLPLEVRPVGVLVTGGIAQSFTPGDETSLLMSYLRLVRQLRSAERAPSIDLRREDVEVLAEHLGQPGESIVDRLGALMGATVAQRRAMAGLFVSGALVIGLAGGSVAALGVGSGGGGSDSTVPARDAATVTILTVDPSSTVVERAADVADGTHALPTIVLDGESHGAPRAAPIDIAVETEAAPAVTTITTVPSVAPTPETPAPSAPDAAAPTSDVGATEDTALSADGSIGVASPVLPPTTDATATDTSVPDVAVDDGTDLFGGDDVATVDDATPPMPADDVVEQAVAPPPVP